MSTPICRSLSLLGALGLCLPAGACNNEEPPTPTLFDEAGAWSVITYDLEGSGQLTDINNDNREDAFMLSFDPEARVVTSAACIEPGQNITPANSPCFVSASTTEWECRCFAYDFVREQMLWREFNAGEVPPEVSLDANDEPMGGDSGTGGAGSGGGAPAVGEDVLVNVAEIEDVAATFNFRPLPLDLFGSNGETSRYILRARTPAVFTLALEDPDRATCTPCVP